MAEIKPQIVDYKPGMTTAQYIDLFRQGVDQIAKSESDVPGKITEVAVYATGNLFSLHQQIQATEGSLGAANAALRRRRNWIIGTAAAGVLATLLAALGGYNSGYNAGDSNLRPAYKSAVTARDRADTENAQLKTKAVSLERIVKTLGDDNRELEEVAAGFREEFKKYFGEPPKEQTDKPEEKKGK